MDNDRYWIEEIIKKIDDQKKKDKLLKVFGFKK